MMHNSTANRFIFISLWLGISTIVAEDSSNILVPFPSKLVNRTFNRFISGTKVVQSDIVIIRETSISLFSHHQSNLVSFEPAYLCNKYLSFHINRDSKLVTISRFPRIKRSVLTPEERNTTETCRSVQERRKEVSAPVGPTAGKFQEQIKFMITNLNIIRLGSEPTPNSSERPEDRLPCGQYFDLESVIGYFRTVAFQNNIFID